MNAVATSNANWETLVQKLGTKKIKLVDLPLLKDIWSERSPGAKNNPVFVHPIERDGNSVSQKLSDIRQKMEKHAASYHIISSLDDVAWTLNLRGSDVQANPVFLSYIILSKNEAKLFVDLEKLDTEARKQMDDSNVKMLPYEDFYSELKTIKVETVMVSPNSNQYIFESLKETNTFIKAPVPGNLMKAIKNLSLIHI